MQSMSGSSLPRGSQPVPSALAVVALAAAVVSYGANAASTSGTASATVVSQIASQPVAIVSPPLTPTGEQQSSVAAGLPLPIRLGFTIDLPSRMSAAAGGMPGRDGEGSSFGMTMIDVDASGIARFSVAGAGATSGYIVQFPASADGLLRQSPTAAGNCPEGGAANASQACQDASLIVPAQALEGGGRLAVEISQALNRLIAGELSVQVNYN